MISPMTPLIESAERLRKLVGRSLPAYRGDDYLRPVPGGCTILSVDPANHPQQGISRSWGSADPDIAAWIAERDADFTARAGPTRPTPEKSLQSHLIRDAIAHGGSMEVLASAFADRPHLRFLVDEIAFVPIGSTRKVVCDLIAVRRDGDVHIPVAIELKSTRLLERLIEQVDDAADMIEADIPAMERLAQASWGERITFARQAERWIVYPADRAGHRGCDDPHATTCADEGVRLITYTEPAPCTYTLHADA